LRLEARFISKIEILNPFRTATAITSGAKPQNMEPGSTIVE